MGARAGPGALGGRAAVRGVTHLPLREAQCVEGLGTARMRGVPSGAVCDAQCGVRARGRMGRAAARGHPDGSRLARPRRVGARRGPAPASGVPWCAARCGAQCGAHALGRRPRPLVAGWHAGVRGRSWVWGGAASKRAWGSSLAAEGPCRAPCGEERAPERHSAGKGG